MVFSSYEFILFLCAVLAGYAALLRYRPGAIPAYLVLASLVFYAWERRAFLIVILLSILFNFKIGKRLSRETASKAMLVFGIAFNLLVLAYYKYSGFLVQTINGAAELTLPVPSPRLPLAISFFTFLQIAYLVDIFRKRRTSYSFTDYTLFVTFFPHLIAGPLVHHNELIPQFIWKREDLARVMRNLAVGLSIFTIGLAKKVLLADSLAPCADRIFDAAAGGQVLSFAENWSGTLAYTLQIYFDFSGYSDMAIGLSVMFGIKLPLNFYSPYKATNIIDFWRRWHITLSRWLKEYLYIPLGGNRKGPARRTINLLITMLLGGLWHGANWTFVIWGGLHGLALCVNHAWRYVTKKSIHPVVAAALTFLFICMSWTFFRAESAETAVSMIGSMAGLNGIQMGSLSGLHDALLIAFGLLIVWILPNTFQLTRAYEPALEISKFDESKSRVSWRPTPGWAIAIALLFLTALAMIKDDSPFLYFKF